MRVALSITWVRTVERGVDAPAEVELAGSEAHDLARLARLASRRNAVLHEQWPHALVVEFPNLGDASVERRAIAGARSPNRSHNF